MSYYSVFIVLLQNKRVAHYKIVVIHSSITHKKLKKRHLNASILEVKRIEIKQTNFD